MSLGYPHGYDVVFPTSEEEIKARDEEIKRLNVEIKALKAEIKNLRARG